MTTSSLETTLTIKNVEASDDSQISCKISNESGIEVTKCQLEVKQLNVEDLKFTKHIKSQNLLEGQALVLQCTAASITDKIDVVWHRNGKEIPQNPDFIQTKENNSFTLTVNEIYPEDSGIFSARLISENSENECICSCSVFVQG